MSKNFSNESEEKNAEDVKFENTRETSQNDMSELSHLKKEATKNNVKKKKKYNDYRDEIANMTENEIKEAIRDFEPIPILDWPKIPYKSICIIFLLFFSSILFIYTGINKYKAQDKWYHWFSYMFLGILLFIPGAYYGFILINIIIGIRGYRYEDIPDLSEQ